MKDSLALLSEACAGRRPARPPLFDILQNDSVIEHFSGRRLDGSADWDVMIQATAAALDGTRSLAAPNRLGEQWKDEVGNVHEAVRWTSWVKQHAFTAAEQWLSWIPGHIERLDARSRPAPAEQRNERARQQELVSHLDGGFYIHCTPSTAINTVMFGYRCGLDALPFLWADEKELIQRWMRAVMSETLRYIELTAHAETGPLAMIYSDVAYHGKLMFSPSMMREMGFFEDVEAICDACHRRGLTVIFHSDGYIMEILDGLVSCGIDGLNPLEKAAGMDIYELRRRYPRLILVGGVDVSRLMPFGTPQEVRQETRRIIEETGAEGRLLIGSSTEIWDDIPLANYLAFHDEAMKG
ncbi:MAG TPA: uroporphyrinogen decarboxylase family protein [Spirochaetia bacterium]|nr:uroporphyrinogen decarboxylase family protein [Spirochaetia bacterium]